ncbi:MAG: DUF4956 domain-containing protein [Chloroflexota bacterium]|nr:MAG: DUF4956 domain-containing protein [Chloroflexota bacterium]
MSTDLLTLAQGAALNLAVALVIVRGIYYPRTPNRNHIFAFLAFNTVIYFVLGLLTSVELSVGVGFGLFAIFSVLRYRTEETPIREMTYLFVLIALPVMNAVLIRTDSLPQLLFANGTVVAVLFVLEQGWGFRFQGTSRVIYERIELIQPERREELLADLRARTGLPVTRVEVGEINFLRDTAELTLFYDQPQRAAAERRPDQARELAAQPHPALER